MIYTALGESPDTYYIVPDKSVASRMNICFRVRIAPNSKYDEKEFIRLAEQRGLTGLKGHRSVGGIRISNYNSISLEGARRLAEFIRKFAQH